MSYATRYNGINETPADKAGNEVWRFPMEREFGDDERDTRPLHFCAGGNRVEERGDRCDEETCQECCPHDERDHGICLDCEHEQDPGEVIDRAMDRLED